MKRIFIGYFGITWIIWLAFTNAIPGVSLLFSIIKGISNIIPLSIAFVNKMVYIIVRGP